MALFQSSIVRNRVLSLLSQEDFALLETKLERVAMPLQSKLIEAHKPIRHVFFPESGIISTIANTDEGRIEVGMIGREGLVGVPAVLGADQTPHDFVVQSAGDALRIDAGYLRCAIARRPSIFRPLALFTHTLMVQLSQTAYANASYNLEGRLARWILMSQDRMGGTDLPITHEFLSFMLGVRRPGVTSATHILEGMGSIRNKRGRIEVRDRGKLLELAGDAYLVAEKEYARVMTHP